MSEFRKKSEEVYGRKITRRFKDSAFCQLYGVPSTAALLINDVMGEKYCSEEEGINS